MNKLNAGDYVRTKSNFILKITDLNEKNKTFKDDGCRTPNVNYPICIIKKSSSNIIDLIEVGDYVNGMQVTRICFDEDGQRILNLSNCILELMNEDIESIVTKEQFENISYKVGE